MYLRHDVTVRRRRGFLRSGQSEKESTLLAVVPRRNLGRESEATRRDAPIRPTLLVKRRERSPDSIPRIRSRDAYVVYVIPSAALDEGQRHVRVRGETPYRFHSRSPSFAVSLSLAHFRDRSGAALRIREDGPVVARPVCASTSTRGDPRAVAERHPARIWSRRRRISSRLRRPCPRWTRPRALFPATDLPIDD